jgi:hypothetical protein
MTTYCTNIHPGESWSEIFSNLVTYIPAVKDAVSPESPFPIGLRLSNLATVEIDKNTSERFYQWCQQNDCYVPTINGFPYGSFHYSPVKENVYVPDWRDIKRVEYTKRLASLLDSWLPGSVTGSISTVPIGFGKHLHEEDYVIVRENLIDVLEYLDRLRQRSGKEIILSLEPEPGCVLETTEDTVHFFEEMKFPEGLRESIGVCFDCCHQAVEFEKPEESLNFLRKASIKIGKVQVSSALSASGGGHFMIESLDRFCDPYYLHQVVVRRIDGNLIRYNDLSEALLVHKGKDEEEWRIHFHVPVFVERMDSYGTTRLFAEEILSIIDRNILLEVETYTWHVLPPELQTETLTQSIIREIQWVQSQINGKNRCS